MTIWHYLTYLLFATLPPSIVIWVEIVWYDSRVSYHKKRWFTLFWSVESISVHHKEECSKSDFFLVNTSGVSRFTKFYTPLHQSAQSVVQKTFSLVSVRPPGLCNFLDAPELEDFLGSKGDADERWRVVYRSYATLYFVFVVDGAESELGILDLIQVCHKWILEYQIIYCCVTVM